MPVPMLSFLVVNYNGGGLLAETLESISHQTFTDYEVIVVDNGSQDRSWDSSLLQRENWSLVRLERNAGFSEANNIAFCRSRGAVIALINNDVVLAPDWAEQVRRAFEDPAVASVACRLLQKRNPEHLDSAGFDIYTCGTTLGWYGLPADCFDGKPHRPFGPVASAAAYRRSAIDQVGLFHREYFAYYEDTDLAMRLALFGLECRYLHNAVGYHLGSATGKRYSDFHRYYLRRNIEFIYWVNEVGALAWKHLPAHVAYEFISFVGMLFCGQGGVFLRAKWHALRMVKWICRQRLALKKSLGAAVGLRAAKMNLDGKFKPFWQVFIRGENDGKIYKAGKP